MPKTSSDVQGVEMPSVQTPDQIDEVIEFWRRENPQLDGATAALRMRLLSAARQLERVLRREMTALDMEMWELETLLTLRRAPDGERRAGELCRSARVTSGAITNRLVRLEERGWVRRDMDPSDRRQVIVTLTPAGRLQADKMISAKLQAEAAFFSGLPRETIERLNADLRDLLVSVEDLPDLCPDTPTVSAPSA